MDTRYRPLGRPARHPRRRDPRLDAVPVRQSLGECLTERSGRINLGLEGTLVFGAMSAYAVAYLTGSPWLGVLGGRLSRARSSGSSTAGSASSRA